MRDCLTSSSPECLITRILLREAIDLIKDK